MVKCEITSVNYHKTPCRPIIANFQNGNINDGSEAKLKGKIYKDPKGRPVPVIASDKIIYSNEIKEDDGDLYDTYLAVRNKETNKGVYIELCGHVAMAAPFKVRLLAVETVSLRAFTPKSLKNSLNTTLTSDKGSIQELNKQFGSKKTKRRTEHLERLKVNIDAVRDQLEETVANVDVSDALTDTTSIATYLPPINIDASNVKLVYKLEELIPIEIFDTLDEQADLLTEAKAEDIQTCDYVKFELLRFRMQNNKQTMKILLVVDSLITMVVTNVKLMQTKAFIPCPYSNLVSKYILDNFTLFERVRTRSLSMKDKAICYAIVFAMIAGDYQLNLENLGKSMKIGVKKLQDMCRVLRLSINFKNKNMAELKLPLPAPPSNFGRKKKGNR